MIPILFPGDAVTYTTNGIGRLAECIRCEVTEERNGIYEAEIELPISARHYADIVEGTIVSLIHDDTKVPQPFIIYRRTAPIDGIVTFFAHHISYLLSGIVVKPYTAASCAAALTMIPAESMSANPFTFWTDKNTTANFNLTAPTGARQILGGMQGSILDVFGGGEYEFDGWTVKLYQDRGTDSGVVIRYGKNLTNIEQDVDISGAAGGVVGWWRGGDPGAEETVYSDIIYADGYGAGSPVISVDFSGDYTEKPTAAALAAKAAAYIRNNKPQEPTVNITIDFVALWQTPEYAHIAPLERVRLCDTVHVMYPALGVNVESKVIRTKYNVLLERYEEIDLGQPRTNFAEMLTAKTEELIQAVPTRSMIQAAIDHATSLITGGLGGYVVMSLNADGMPEEILIMDTDDITTAVNVIRMNRSGIGFSTNGYQGPFTSAWTIDGHFVADFIDTGSLNANIITAGILEDATGRNYWNLESGDIKLYGDIITEYNDLQSGLGSHLTPWLADASDDVVWSNNAGFYIQDALSATSKPYYGVFADQYRTIEHALVRGGNFYKYVLFDDSPTLEGASGTAFEERITSSIYALNARTFGQGSHTINYDLQLSTNIFRASGTYALTIGNHITIQNSGNTESFRIQGSNFWIYAGNAGIYNSGIYLYYLDNNGNQYTIDKTSSSSRRYKHDIGVLSDPALDPHHLLDLQAVQFVYNTAAALQYEDMRGQLLPGFIAEDVEKVYPAAVIRNEAGDVESWDERRIIPGMLVLIQEQQKTIDSQAKKMAELEGRIARLEKLLGMN